MAVGFIARIRATVAKLKLSTHKHIKRTVAYVRAHPPWLWEARIFCLAFLGTVGIPAAILVLWPHEDIIRYVGLLLQLAGIGTVWWGIRKTRKLFDHPSFWVQMRQWFRRRPKYRVPFVAVGVAAVSGSTAVTGRASVWMDAGPDAPLEQRVEVLEKNLARVRETVERFQNKTEESLRSRDEVIRQEQKARESGDQGLREKLKATETGGLHISAVGALWLLAGVTMGTIPGDLARWFG